MNSFDDININIPKKYDDNDDKDENNNSNLRIEPRPSFIDNHIVSKYPSVDSVFRSALEYYDSHQPQIQKLLNQIDNIIIVNNYPTSNRLFFRNAYDEILLESRFETLSMVIPQTKTWMWSWALPSAELNENLISRKILEYAFTLSAKNDYLLKSTLINSKTVIENRLQLDIYLSLSAFLSKKPFIFKLYKRLITNNDKQYIYPYGEIIKDPNKHTYIVEYYFILDWTGKIGYDK